MPPFSMLLCQSQANGMRTRRETIGSGAREAACRRTAVGWVGEGGGKGEMRCVCIAPVHNAPVRESSNNGMRTRRGTIGSGAREAACRALRSGGWGRAVGETK
jgi:hypothetical protein